MNTYTPTHAARPSRLRIARALLSSWYDRNAHALALSYVAVIVATFAAITAVAMRIDMSASMSHAVSVAVLISGVALFASMLAYMLATSRAEEVQAEYYARVIAELEQQNKKMTRDYSEAMHYLNDACDDVQAQAQVIKQLHKQIAEIQNEHANECESNVEDIETLRTLCNQAIDEKEDYLDALSAALTELEIVRDALQAKTKRRLASN